VRGKSDSLVFPVPCPTGIQSISTRPASTIASIPLEFRSFILPINSIYLILAQVEQRLYGSSGQIELYPSDIADFTIWSAPKSLQAEVHQAVNKGFAAKQRAAQLLESAKRAVEIAIEQNEAAAMNYLKDQEAANNDF